MTVLFPFVPVIAMIGAAQALRLALEFDPTQRRLDLVYVDAKDVLLQYEGLNPSGSFKDNGMTDVLVIMGGVIPDMDFARLKELGIHEVFPPGLPESCKCPPGH